MPGMRRNIFIALFLYYCYYSKGWPELEKLYLTAAPITGETIEKVAWNCKKLKFIDLTACYGGKEHDMQEFLLYLIC